MEVTTLMLAAKRLAMLPLLALTLLFTGCLQLEGIHVVNHHGDADQGSYRLSMPTYLYAANLEQSVDLLADLRRHSNPQTWSADGQTYVADTSGNAEMEHLYDRFRCEPAPQRGWSDCFFSMSKNDLTFPGWRVDWKVVLHKEMVVLQSNHHRVVRRNGENVLVWQFDGNRVNGFDIRFALRVPNA